MPKKISKKVVPPWKWERRERDSHLASDGRLQRQNGIVHPRASGITGVVWDIADRLSYERGQPARRAALIAECKHRKIKYATAATQFGRWRKFHGIKGRVPKI